MNEKMVSFSCKCCLAQVTFHCNHRNLFNTWDKISINFLFKGCLWFLTNPSIWAKEKLLNFVIKMDLLTEGSLGGTSKSQASLIMTRQCSQRHTLICSLVQSFFNMVNFSARHSQQILHSMSLMAMYWVMSLTHWGQVMHIYIYICASVN